VDFVARSERSVPGVLGWFPRWVLAAYGVALGAAGLAAAEQAGLAAPLRAVGVSSFVLGVGCVLLATRQQPRRRAKKPKVEAPGAIPSQPGRDEFEVLDPMAEAARLERLEAELADERARVDRMRAELAALHRVVVEQRQNSRFP
jgi:hypothetical protein